jgi:hypothetical protein
LIHYIIVHLLTEDPALIEQPRLLSRADIVAGVSHIRGFGDFAQESHTATDSVVHLFEMSRV